MSKRCAEAQEEIAWLLLEGPAEGSGSAALASHRKECPRCALDEENLRVLLGSLGGQDIPDPGDAYWREFLPRVRNRIAVERNRAASRRPGWLGSWALGATAASFVLASLAMSQWSIPPEIRALAQFQRMAGRSMAAPSQVSTGALSSRMGAARGTEGDGGGTAESEMEKVLEETFPEDDADVYGSASELGSEERQRLEKTLGLDWV